MTPRVRLEPGVRARDDVAAGLARVRAELAVPASFPAEVLAEAQRAAAGAGVDGLPDRRDVALQTLDPAGSRDLDQAFAVAREGPGFVVHYAVADVAAVVRPAAPVDVEARSRGVTLYLPDGRANLHPPVLSEGVASLLPGQDTPALLWRFALDADGGTTALSVERALVRSRHQLSYDDAQQALDAGAATMPVRLLAQVGDLLAAREAARGGVSLDLPDQQVVATDHGYGLRFDRARPIERANAQLSLLTGMAAAQLMLDGGTGVLRTLPPAPDDRLAALRRVSTELGVPWHASQSYAEWVRSVDPASPRGVALLTQALRTYRGAGYVVVRGTPPPVHRHTALAAAYAHVTAPLRRLVDRFANQIVLDLVAGREVQGWVTEVLDELPGLMGRATQRAAAVDRAVEDLVEAVLLQHRVGEVFGAVTADRRGDATVVHLLDPAVVAQVDGALPLGERVDVRLVAADPVAATVRFAVA